jgi:hypothetical protein
MKSNGFTLLFFLFIFISTSMAQVPANIIIKPDSERIAISPYVFGAGDEMNSNFSPLSQIKPLIEATKPSLLRFGGIAAEYLDWEADSLGGISYVDFVDTLILPQPVNFGIDSFLRLCEDIDCEPILTVNMHISDTALAGRMVEYVNGDTTTPMGQLRLQRGHPQPYNVSIWSLGNEPDIAGGEWPVPPWGVWTFYRHYGIAFENWSWQDSVFWTPQEFANLIPSYVNAMENASPIPLQFIYSIAGDPAWLRPVIEPNINFIDYLDIHYYPSGIFDSIADTTDYIEWLSKTDTIYPAEPYVNLFRDSLDAMGASSIEVVVLEYNSGIIIIPDALWWNYLTGLFIADCIGHWMHAGLEMGAVYSIHEGSPGSTDFPYFGVVRGDSISRRMASYVLELYNTYFGDTLVYSFSDHRNSGYGIECWASHRNFDGRYAAMVINKTLDTTYSVTVRIEDSLQSFHILDISNNAPIGAPYNGTTGIEEQGTFPADSIRDGWSYLTRDFLSKTVSLIEAAPFTGIEEVINRQKNKLLKTSVVRKGSILKFSKGDYVLYTVAGREVLRWSRTDELKIPYISSGIYFLKFKSKKFKKLIVF